MYIVFGITYDTSETWDLTTNYYPLFTFETKAEAEEWVTNAKTGYVTDDEGCRVYVDEFKIEKDEPEFMSREWCEMEMIDYE